MGDENRIRIIQNKQEKREIPEGFAFTPETAGRVRAFHRSFPGYCSTPLVELKELAALLQVEKLYVKDESARFGLNSFKALGGSYAIGRYIADRLGLDSGEMTYSRLVDDETRARSGSQIFVTATDGNHGRGVAWTAKQIQQKCIVFLPQGSARERLENIRSLGAEAFITDLNYDDTVRLASSYAAAHQGILVQDTGGPDSGENPIRIMQGYLTMVDEAIEQMDGQVPTHVFLQAGVGAMAGAAAGYLAARFGSRRPITVIVEPDQADCVFRTAEASDGKLHSVEGSLPTMMAGLACGEPCWAAWQVLQNCADYFVSMPDSVAAVGMRVLGAPLCGDRRIISGESGAAGFGLAVTALHLPEAADLKKQLKLGENSRILCLSTEGATDRENYRRVVWGV